MTPGSARLMAGCGGCMSLLGLFALVYLALFFNMLATEPLPGATAKVDGVISANVPTSTKPGVVRYDITYGYAVEGVPYIGEMAMTGPSKGAVPYPIGSKVVVHYDPQNPDGGEVIDPGPFVKKAVPNFTFAGLLITGGIWMVVVAKRKLRKPLPLPESAKEQVKENAPPDEGASGSNLEGEP